MGNRVFVSPFFVNNICSVFTDKKKIIQESHDVMANFSLGGGCVEELYQFGSSN